MKKFIKIFLISTISIILTLGIYIFGRGYIFYKNTIKTMSLQDKVLQIQQADSFVSINDMPKEYKNAVIAVEDHRFYDHSGIDILAILGAVINDLSNGKLVQGGSTITQQICKNIYFTQDRRLERKVAETFMAAKLEDTCSKDEILELYINTCFYGNTVKAGTGSA